MKFTFLLFATWLCLPAHAQSGKGPEATLLHAFERIQYWNLYADDPASNIDKADSVAVANEAFDKLLCQLASQNDALLTLPMPTLIDKGLEIISSPDGRIHVYTWDETSSTNPMGILRSVIQYKSGTKCYALSAYSDDIVPNLRYLNIHTIKKGKETFYVVESSYKMDGLQTNYVSIYGIQGAALNRTVKLIKTKSGMTHQLKYSFAPEVLNELAYERSFPNFDEETKTLSIPVVKGTSDVTEQRIYYPFNGQYFERK